ncbi:MAG: pyridoxal-phosphate dependent enzyme [Gemmatimonadales bacterium]|nr:pyridoxal-phosphate dependent enzyme [Gemmatimonadales bacterium]
MVPIGGGGLIAGVAAAVKLTQPGVRVYGVEPEGAAAMRRSLDAGRAIRLEQIATIADGLASPMAGELTYAIVKQYVDDVVTVTDHEILRAMGMILSRAKLLAEPSGAAATAALLARRIPVDEHDRVIAVVSGGNVSVDKLGELLGEDRD